jgi:hypothetical protein
MLKSKVDKQQNFAQSDHTGVGVFWGSRCMSAVNKDKINEGDPLIKQLFYHY